MKILLSNKFYYRRGGDCVCTINLEELLKRKGHEVAIFAMQYPDNIETPWSKYFPGEVKFKPGLGMLEALLRPFGTNEVKRKFTALLDDFCPDIVHLNNIHSQLSPVIAEIAHQKGNCMITSCFVRVMTVCVMEMLYAKNVFRISVKSWNINV